MEAIIWEKTTNNARNTNGILGNNGRPNNEKFSGRNHHLEYSKISILWSNVWGQYFLIEAKSYVNLTSAIVYCDRLGACNYMEGAKQKQSPRM